MNFKPLAVVATLGALVFLALPARAVIRDGGIDPANLGKGDWIYFMSAATNKLGGNVASVTNEVSLMKYYQSVGVRYIIIKAATDDFLFNGSYATPQFTSNLVNIARTNGILIFGYNRSYGDNVPGEIAISDYVFNQGADGFVWDAESEWESSQPWITTNGPAKAWTLCSTVRSNWPNKFLAHAPFPIISYHASFPYKEFGYWCDAVMPQIYPHNWTGVKSRPSGGINWTDVNWQNWQNATAALPPTNINGLTVYWTNAIKPIAAVNHVYGPNPPNTGVSEIPAAFVMEFIDCLAADPNTQTAGGYKGANFWRADLHGSGQWTNIKGGTSGDFPGIVNNLVLDDASATRVGSWTHVRTFYNGASYGYAGDGTGTDINSFGTNYFVKSQGTGSDYMQFTPTVIVDGHYDLYEWHPIRTDASAAVPFVINYQGGITTNYANQQTNGGTWSRLGRYPFAAGTNAYIRVRDDFPDAGNVALVDGLKLVFVLPTNAPAAPSGLLATAASATQINLTWTDHATNEINYLVTRALVPGGPYTNIATLPANSTSYSDPGLAAETTYYYLVAATNNIGQATAGPANATTSPLAPTAPGITNQPQDLTVVAGENATFTVTATGTAPRSYQWRFNNVNLPNATNNSYTRVAAQTNDAGGYHVVITNAVGAITSSVATLTVNFSLTLNATPGGGVSPDPNLPSYPPNTNVTVTATPQAGYTFAGWTGDAFGSSNPLIVTLTTNKTIAATFLNTNVDIFLDNTNSEVTFVGDWQTGTSSVDKYLADYRFASALAGGTSNVTYRPAIGLPGYYNVFIWYPQGSNRATNAPWTVVYDGGSTNVAVDQTVNGGNWRLLATALPFQTGTNGYVRLSNDTGYSGKVVMADGVRFSFVQPFNTAPTISAQPQSLTVKVGSNVTFSVTATGTPPPSYQWRFANTNIPGATSSNYTRLNVQLSDAGNYSVGVTNVAGGVASSNAVLNVQLPVPVQFQSITRLLDGRMRLVISGEPGVGLWIDRAGVLPDWLELTNLFNTNGIVDFTDDSATNSGQGFYRARQ